MYICTQCLHGVATKILCVNISFIPFSSCIHKVYDLWHVCVKNERGTDVSVGLFRAIYMAVVFLFSSLLCVCPFALTAFQWFTACLSDATPLLPPPLPSLYYFYFPLQSLSPTCLHACVLQIIVQSTFLH